MTKLAVFAAAALLLLPALAISAATGGIDLATPSSPALADVPPDYLLLYQQAGLAFDVPWEVLAAVGKVECDHGRHPHAACRQHQTLAGAHRVAREPVGILDGRNRDAITAPDAVEGLAGLDLDTLPRPLGLRLVQRWRRSGGCEPRRRLA